MMVDEENAAADRGLGCRGCYVVRLVELRGFEPLTPRLPALCSPN